MEFVNYLPKFEKTSASLLIFLGQSFSQRENFPILIFALTMFLPEIVASFLGVYPGVRWKNFCTQLGTIVRLLSARVIHLT